MFISSFSPVSWKKIEINLLIIFIFGLFSNFASAQGLPLQDFDAGVVPPTDWSVKSNITVTNNWTTTTTAFSGTGAAMVNPALNSTVGTKAEYYLITPQFITPNVTELRFFTRLGQFTPRGTTFDLRVATVPNPSIADFNVSILDQPWTEADFINKTTYEERIITIPPLSIPAGTPVYFAFVAITQQTGTASTIGNTWYIDNVRVIDSCAKIEGINSTMSANSGIINWTHNSTTDFEIQIIPKGTGVTENGTPVNGFSYTATGLTDGTEYDVYIKTVCDATTKSYWAGPFPVKTARLGLSCATPIVIPDISVNPYILSANLATFHDNQTYTPINSKSVSCTPVGADMNFLLGEHAILTYSPTVTGFVNVGFAVENQPTCQNIYSSVFIFDSCTGIGTTANCYGALITGQPSSNTSGELSNLLMEAGKTYYFYISSPYQHYDDPARAASICFTFTLSQPTCAIPSEISYNTLLQTSAKFSWISPLLPPNETQGEWQYLAKPTDQGLPNGSEILTTTNGISDNIVSGLTANTSYNFYVRKVCEGVPGPWSKPFPFKTLCAVYPAPYSTNFTGATPTAPEPCWTSFDLNKDGIGFTYSGDPGNPPVQGQLVRLSTQLARNQTNDLLATPQIKFDGLKQKRLRFTFKGYGGYTNITDGFVIGESSFSIKLSTTGVGPANFDTEVLPVKTYQTGNNFVEMRVPLPENTVGDVSIAWHLPPNFPNTANNLYIDDVYIEDQPDCDEPLYPEVVAGSITNTSAQFKWLNGYKNTQWEVLVQPVGSATPTETSIGQLVSVNPVTITGLTPSTRCEYYVRAHCGATFQSVWAGPVKFNTLCDAQPVPYYESLNDTDTTSKKFCWSINNKNGDLTQWTIGATEASIATTQFTQPFTEFDDYLISVPINVAGQKMLKFKYKVATSVFTPIQRGNVEVLMSSTPDFSNPTVLIPSHDFSNGDFLEDSVIFNGTGPAYFAFHVPPTMVDPEKSGVIVIDDFSIDDAPACSNPAYLTATNVLLNSATLSWKKGFNETQWEVVIQSPLSGVPTGSGTVVNTNPSYNVTGLIENTNYEYYVRAVCGANYSEWIGPYQFKTICSVVPTPFIETFEKDSATKSCWTIVNNNGNSHEWGLDMPVEPMFGEKMAALNCFSNGNNDDWLISPTLAVKPNQRLRFYYKSKYFTDYSEDLKVRVSTNGLSIDQFSTILYENSVHTTTNAGTVSGSNTITVASGTGIKEGDAIYIENYPFPYATKVTSVNGTVITLAAPATKTIAGPLQVIFNHEVINNLETKEMVIYLTEITAATNINIAFHVPTGEPNTAGNGLRGSYLFLDNIIVEDIPACPSVYNIATDDKSIADTSAPINWETKGSETSWEISVQPFGTPAPVGNTLPEYLHTATAHPYTITGLIPSTKYQYYVRAVCSGSSQSEWTGPIDLLTKCDQTNACQYTISVTNGNTGQVYTALDVIQNGVVQQSLTFPVVAPNQPTVIDYQVYLCSGIEFNLFWRGSGSGVQYSQAQVVIKDESGATVFTSPLGLGTINTNIFTGVSNCKAVTCPQPTNLAVNNLGVLSWTPGGSETQWEVFVQPLALGSIPQKGVIVDTPSYTPGASDFAIYPTAGTNEFFVRAICGISDTSYWTGPKVFIRNDEPTTAISLQVNTNGDCASRGIKGSFIGATASVEPTSCSGTNQGDIWYEFVATSKVHTVEISNITGNYYAATYGPGFPTFILSLYEVQADGSLVEKACSENNSLVAAYSSELTVGNTYKIRVKNASTAPTDTKFDICISTPAEICDMDAFNYSFEKLPMQNLTGISTIIHSKVIPGWRTNTDSANTFVQEVSNAPGGQGPYEGSQFLQLTQDPANTWDPAGPIKGLYKDFATPAEVLKVNYSFASASRLSGIGTTLELWAGPPTGPFTMITEHTATTVVWSLIKGTYVVPTGQTTTRFIFRVRGNAIGHLLDAANFKANTDVITKDITIPCHITSVSASAEGVGEWIADTDNPAQTIIETPTSQTTVFSGFNTPGVYTYYWKTRYCEKPFRVTYEGFYDVATTISPVEYCINETATALTATAPAGFTLEWYTVPVGGTGDVNAPIPLTGVTGTTIYYVGLVNPGGCKGPRIPVEVVVSDYSNPITAFSYDKDKYCVDGANPIITTDENFMTGGTYTATPTGLDINASTGAINLSSSTPNVEYTVTYSIPQQDCYFAGSHSVIVKVDGACGFIQKGISPNGDGLNDSFDLSRMNIKKLIIYNRYGTEVYVHGEGYTNQWTGQSNSGQQLPDATYFYYIIKEDNSTVTGWVYINKQL